MATRDYNGDERESLNQGSTVIIFLQIWLLGLVSGFGD